MSFDNQIVFKIADKVFEFNQIHELNYSTFVEEIPQHSKNSSKKLIDKFHDQNTYIVCLKDSELIGMIAVRDKRPFSLDQKLEDLDSYLPSSVSICEIRLLSIKKKYRTRKIISGLFSLLAEYCEKNHYDLALISATTRELKLYRKLGFVEFGPLVGCEGAYYQPMYLTPSSYLQFKSETSILKIPKNSKKKEILLLPGPVRVSEKVRRAFESKPISHRSQKFLNDFNHAKKMLCDLSRSNFVEIFMGSGTLANDVVAGQLSNLNQDGIILSNGHFGERLFDHAQRFTLNYVAVQKKWAETFNIEELEKLIKNKKPGWLWFVHCETSTGLINKLSDILRICLKNDVKLCVDCISSIGASDIDLSKVYLASGVSGKSLASYPGLSFVFYNHEFIPSSYNIPKYIDLGYYKQSKGVPFTISSNVLYALKASLKNIDISRDYELKSKLNRKVRDSLFEIGVDTYKEPNMNSSNVITIKLDSNYRSSELGEFMENKGVIISYRSEYLIENNLVQIALMGEVTSQDIEIVIEVIKKYFTNDNLNL